MNVAYCRDNYRTPILSRLEASPAGNLWYMHNYLVGAPSLPRLNRGPGSGQAWRAKLPLL